jgi:anthranilate phosphoribosyltransferase
VLANVAVALVVEGRASSAREGYELARQAIDGGEAGRRVERLKEASRAA